MIHDLAQLGLVSLAGGCALISSTSQIIEEPAGIRHIERVVPGSRSYIAVGAIDGDKLVVTLSSNDVCEVGDVPLTRRIKVTTSVELPRGGNRVIWQEYVVGGILLAAGAAVAGDPERACRFSDENDGGGETKSWPASSCRALGLSMLGVGALSLGSGIYDTYRLRTRRENLGESEGTTETSRTSCNDGPLAEQAVTVRFPDGARVAGVTSRSGRLVVALDQVPRQPLAIWGAHPELLVGRERVAIAMADGEWEALAALLAGEVRSADVVLAPPPRDARDAAACDVARSEAAQSAVQPSDGDERVNEVRGLWAAARIQCSARWSDVDERTWEYAERAIFENRQRAAIVALHRKELTRVAMLLDEYAELPPALRAEAWIATELSELVAEPVNAVLSGDRAAEVRLCVARGIARKILGDADWNYLVAEIGQRGEEMGMGTRASIAARIRSAECRRTSH